MPVQTASNVGAITTVDGLANYYEEITVIPAAAVNTNVPIGILGTNQLPNLSFYVERFVASIATIDVSPQYSIRIQDTGIAQQFMPLPGGLVPATDNLLLTYTTPANFITMILTVGPDPAAGVVQLRVVMQGNS